MISHLGIQGLGVIRAADVDLTSGLVVFTGETGAGKTMLVSALGLVLGDRFDSALLGQDGTRVEATVDIADSSPVLERVREAGGDVESTQVGEASLIIGRHVPAHGRGRAVAGGATVPLSVLAEVGESIAQRHSQSDQISLRSPRMQRHALDRFGGADVAQKLATYRQRYGTYLEVSGRLTELVAAQNGREDRLRLLRAELESIDEVAPQAHEDTDLTTAIARLSNAEALRTDLELAVASVAGDDAGESSAVGLVGRAAEAVARAAGHDPALTDKGRRLLDLQEQLADVALELRSSLASVSVDPEELARAQTRKAQITALVRRFGGNVAAVLEYSAEIRTELELLVSSDQSIGELRDAVSRAVSELSDAADALPDARRRAASRLSEAVTAELAGLAMPQAGFTVNVGHREDPGGLELPDGSSVAFGESGTDVVRFLLAPHSGAAPAPIGDGASGGELSRIMLALEVVLAASSPPSVFIFDEVDAGIGGRTAVEVGRRLARLAEHSQVLVVTHLPQVASFADQHIVVQKDSEGRVTRTSITEVTGAERTAELSRMLSGQDTSAAAQAHAEELLDLAALEARSRKSERGSSRR